MSKECLFLVPWTDLVRWIICSLFVISGNCLCCCHIINTFVFLMNTVIDWSVTKCTSCWLVNQSLSDCLDNHFSLIGFCYTLIHVGQSLSLTDHELLLFFLQPGSPTLRILHISDIHIDPAYEVGSKVKCGEPLCCRQGDGKAGDGLIKTQEYLHVDQNENNNTFLYQTFQCWQQNRMSPWRIQGFIACNIRASCR